jgi:prepilin-type N-terminal cleavage/methylation domain-containing protein
MTAWFVQLRSVARRRRAFTLVEMLVVIVIICILAGIVFYLTQAAGDYKARAITVANLQKTRAAIEEFHAQYGVYPPVGNNDPNHDYSQPYAVGYEMPSVTGMNQTAYSLLVGTYKTNVVFNFNLMSYLTTRYPQDLAYVWADANYGPLFLTNSNPQWGYANNMGTSNTPFQQASDKNFTDRVAPIFDNGVGDGGVIYTTITRPEIVGGVLYTNNVLTVLDGWNNELMYQSAPPFQSYDLWSYGPKGLGANPADYIHSMPGK